MGTLTRECQFTLERLEDHTLLVLARGLILRCTTNCAVMYKTTAVGLTAGHFIGLSVGTHKYATAEVENFNVVLHVQQWDHQTKYCYVRINPFIAFQQTFMPMDQTAPRS